MSTKIIDKTFTELYVQITTLRQNKSQKDEKSDLHQLERQKECTYRRPKWARQDGPILSQSNYGTYQHLRVRASERTWQATGAIVEAQCGTKPFLGRRTGPWRGGGDCRKYKEIQYQYQWRVSA